MKNKFKNLPKEIHLYILSFLDPFNLESLSRVSKQWNELCRNQLLWQAHFSKLVQEKDNAKLVRITINGLKRTEPEQKKRKFEDYRKEYITYYKDHICLGKFFKEIDYKPPINEVRIFFFQINLKECCEKVKNIESRASRSC